MRYVQEYAGQKLHLASEFPDGSVMNTALCGRVCMKRGNWRLSINVPMGMACKSCLKVAAQRAKPLPTIGVTVNIG